ncbi:hypothetical protein [Leptolyngbya sp. 7M]|uniref:hypothetical protein n=1 Tax=Leptolyngbya sp. 7M TaxID=2812896 RepID=UPI001B8CDA89|nr:hypothetical protein [Leptolyngbya sp. 7M]QYO65866.1 hypothetical protein JVX88_03455 [Leptolyngbya sp. 7M]
MQFRSAWTFALITAAVVVALAFIPQLSLWRSVGENWTGSYAAANYDEVAYSAYVNGLIHGKPRRYDPYKGRETEHESIFSVQFIPAYTIAVTARMFGISASTAFIVLHVIFAFFSSIAIFWFLWRVTEDKYAAASGTLVVLCLGTAITLEGAFRELIGGDLVIEYFPFLRRYQPGFAFPIFFVMCGAIWNMFRRNNSESGAWAVAAGVFFAILVYSYFYLWTAAIVWIAVVVLLVWVTEKGLRLGLLRSALVITSIGVSALAPYFYLLNLRSRNADEVQLLTMTREPDVSSPTVIIALITLLFAAILHFLRRIDGKSLQAIFAYAFVSIPVIVLNQQIITGRSLQPVHYEIFIANYCLLAGIVILAWLALRGLSNGLRISQITFVVVGMIAAIWGVFEAAKGVERNKGMVAVREAVYPTAEYIRSRSLDSHAVPVIHTANPIIASFLPTVVPSRILWTPHLVAGGSVSETEAKMQFYRFLYFSGFKDKHLESALRTRWFEMVAAVFGGGRALPQLGGTNHPITDEEIVEEARLYAQFAAEMNAATAYDPMLNYFIVPDDDKPDLTNLDRWYTRDEGTVIGLFRVYVLAPKH